MTDDLDRLERMVKDGDDVPGFAVLNLIDRLREVERMVEAARQEFGERPCYCVSCSYWSDEDQCYYPKTRAALDRLDREETSDLRDLKLRCPRCGWTFTVHNIPEGEAASTYGPDAEWLCPHCGKETTTRETVT